MRRGPFIFLGVFFAMAVSWLGAIVVPQLQFGRAQQIAAGPTGIRYPAGRPGLAQQGSEVYRANGCYYCHTQQVRPDPVGADLRRGWGTRFNVAQDYLLDAPVMFGDVRVGPDLANMGRRIPLTFGGTTAPATGNPPSTNEMPAIAEWHLKHLYNPRITSPGSNMPRYPYLFDEVKRRKDEPPAENALKLPQEFAPAPETGQGDYVVDVVPRHEAVALVEYLMSLKADVPLFEAPLPKPAQDAAAEGATNQVGTTNTSPVNPPVKPADPAAVQKP